MYMAKKLLDSGSQAQVYQAYVQHNDVIPPNANEQEPYIALKVFNTYAACNSGGRPAIEYGLLQQLKGHPNIIEVFNYYNGDGNATFLPGTIKYQPMRTEVKSNLNVMSMEFCTHRSLIDIIIEKGAFTDESLLKHLMLQICKGVDAMHTVTKHAHLDLKPDNIMIGDDYLLKLIDFGFAHPIDMDILKHLGTDGYEAPEIKNRMGLNVNKTYRGV